MLKKVDDKFHFEDNDVLAIMDSATLHAQDVSFKHDDCKEMSLESIAQYIVLYKNVRHTVPFAHLEMNVH